MSHNATDILDSAESTREQVTDHIRDGADWFHDREGELFKRAEARDRLADDLGIDDDIAQSVVSGLVGDDVDPIVQARANGTKYVGVVEFTEFDGAYGYVDYHDTLGQRKRVICAQCVHDATLDTEVTHATAGDPSGSYGPDAEYDELLNGIHDHYEDAHDGVTPSEVETGASLVSGTTIGGNLAWHMGNDGEGSGLNADRLDGRQWHGFVPASTSGYGDISSYRQAPLDDNVCSISGSGVLLGGIATGSTTSNWDIADLVDVTIDGTTNTLNGSDWVLSDSHEGFTTYVPPAQFDSSLDIQLTNTGEVCEVSVMTY